MDVLAILIPALFAFTVTFGLIGVIRFIRTMPMLDTSKTKGLLIDARITSANIMDKKDFTSDQEYLYYTYEVEGVTHGSCTLTIISSAKSRAYFKELVAKFSKKGEGQEIDVYVNKSDHRKSYLLSPSNVSNPHGKLALIALAITIILYLIKGF